MSAALREETRFILSDAQARQIAKDHGTPLYVLSEEHLRSRMRSYIQAMQAAWPNSEVAFASKANSTLAVLAIAHQEGCLIDVASEGELTAALRAGVPAERCHLHGNNKSISELEYAIKCGVGKIIIDCHEEIERIHRLNVECPPVMLRLSPGVDPLTNAKISTGQSDTKFGFNIGDGNAEKALVRCLELGLPVKGFHCHVGSQLLNPTAQIDGARFIAAFARDMKEKHGFEVTELNVGGGLGIRYTEEDQPTPVDEYCASVASAMNEALEGAGLAKPKLVHEPGRWLVGESGVTLYEVGVIKTVPKKEGGTRTYVAVDGGLADNPRPAMYGSPYPVRHITEPERICSGTKMVTISGRHCETDRLFESVEVGDCIAPDDLIQVLCTGAYNSTMASNYNRYARPATILLRPDGRTDLVQRPETWDEMFGRESVPTDLS